MSTGMTVHQEVSPNSLAANAQFYLSSSDRDDLARSGISSEVAQQHGIRTVTKVSDVQSLLRHKSPVNAQTIGSCLLLPYHDAQGKPNGYCRLKPSKPSTGADGKTRKYLGPRGLPVGVYFPRLAAHYHDVTVPVIITEGEKKALCAAFHGFSCLGLGGVACWSKKRDKDAHSKPIGQRELHHALAELPWKGRLVYIAFDSDRDTKEAVQREEYQLALALKTVGAIVRIVKLPPGEGGKKQGLDDYLVACGAEALQGLLAASLPPSPPAGSSLKSAADSIVNPHNLAQSFLATISPLSQPRQLHWWNGEFLIYVKGAYQIFPQGDLRARMTSHIRSRFVEEYQQQGVRKKTREVKVRLVGDVINALQSICHLPSHLQPPTWLTQDAHLPEPHSVLPMQNGLLHWDMSGKCQLLPPNPSLLTLNAVPFEYSSNAPEPIQWLAFLKTLWPSEAQSIDSLQEWFGYLLTTDTRLQKMLMLIGPKRSGKGTILRVLGKLIGLGNVVNPTLSSLGTQFGLAALVGRTVAIISDARLGHRHDQAVITERLLSITGEDFQTIDRKYRDPLNCRLQTRFVLASNELPRLSDTSGALSGRMIILRLCNSFFGQEDIHLEDKLCTELPGILLWAIEGLIRLRQRGCFLQTDSGNTLAQELEDLTSPVGAFVRDMCVKEESAVVPIETLFIHWKTWCQTNGREHSGTQQNFGRDLHAAVPHLATTRPVSDGKRIRQYQGIRLRREDEEDPMPSAIPAPSAVSAVFPIVSHRKIEVIEREDCDEEITIRKTADIADTADCADGTAVTGGVFDL